MVGTYNGKSFAEGEAAGSAYPTLRQLPMLGVVYESKFEKLKIEEAVYKTLRQELDSAKMQESRENPAVEVLDLPMVPERKSLPPRLLIVVTGTGCAVIFGGVWILGAARWRETGTHHPVRVLMQEIFGTVRWQFAMAAMNRAEENDQWGKSDGSAAEQAKSQSA